MELIVLNIGRDHNSTRCSTRRGSLPLAHDAHNYLDQGHAARRRTSSQARRRGRQSGILMEASRGTRRSRLTVLTMYAMHLMDLSERLSAISMGQRARRNWLPFSCRRWRDGGGGDSGGFRGIPAPEGCCSEAYDGHLQPRHHPRPRGHDMAASFL